MSGAAIVIGISFLLILVGLAMAICAKKGLEPGIIATVVYWVGIALLVVGLFLLLTPVAVWLTAQFKAMLDIH